MLRLFSSDGRMEGFVIKVYHYEYGYRFESTYSNVRIRNCEVARKKVFAASTGSNPWPTKAIQLRWSHVHFICISAVHNSPHSMFHSFYGLINSINWPASSVWVFITQLVEHCSPNSEATGSNPIEAPKSFCFRATSQLLKLRFTAMVI